ncbi:hypothetical protein N7517_009014 [Penicillium concentricum]|uniref:Uncharacterized protein n=1 Tax=Penicillium concentricum TaxID=293559 RepID=A0A9W9RGF9_9EURO|nr:uncharacterized protein N7517_009014 [Penicillium concentricum]KAJ5359823.1 hypothetical protein N7517_009014 [Penicillium concentricum]
MESLHYGRPLLLLPQRLKGFSPLGRINSLGLTRRATRDVIDGRIQSDCVRQKAPAELLEPFRLRVKVDELDMRDGGMGSPY